ncbi:hypothetical protein FM996_18850 [Methylosinus sporium]|uniref:Uncharacterized protein n=1 Tax=Methylosinus sporium TaxID=428 RepID=A0A549SEJ6_METSR|nr:hypothetical protein FM996_18850 [Methylosinus sporium]
MVRASFSHLWEKVASRSEVGRGSQRFPADDVFDNARRLGPSSDPTSSGHLLPQAGEGSAHSSRGCSRHLRPPAAFVILSARSSSNRQEPHARLDQRTRARALGCRRMAEG